MSLAPAEQSIQLLTCHISRWKLCHRSPQDNQSKSWKKSVTSVFLSLITSHAINTSRAEQTTFYRGRATTSFISYHQLKTWTLILKTISLNLGRRCGQTEIVCHWSLLMSLELAEQSIQLLTCHISRWRLCHRSQQDNQSKSWKKVWLLFFCHWSLLMLLAPSGQSIQLLICHVSRWRLCRCSPQDNQSKSREKVWPLVFCHWGWCLWHLGTVCCWCT
jgi:phage gp36-like protein